MRQVLLWLGPLPIYGFGAMLFVTFVACYILLGRRAEREGIRKQFIHDLAIWIFVAGIIGARIVFMIQYQVPLQDFYKVWEGGLVFYGSAIGGLVGFLLGWWFIIRKHGIDVWVLADVIAPAIALGLALGRIGCLLNGCCYGHVACADCPAVHFPLAAPPRFTLVERGYQTPAGFALDDFDPLGRTVRAVEPGSPAAVAGLQAGDVIVGIDGLKVAGYADLWNRLVPDWPRGKADLELTVDRAGQTVTLPPFEPRTLGLHPTQLYETISMFLMFLLLLAWEPFQRRRGELMVILMLGYGVHRFINESLRNDTATYTPLGEGLALTLSQWISIVVFAGGLVLLAVLLRRPTLKPPAPAPALADAPAGA